MPAPLGAADDWRNIRHGRVIPTATYADQPYIVQTDDSAWLCLVTAGARHEGAAGQHVISLRSTDHGHTWDPSVPLEPATGPEASYAVPLKLPGGRIYAFYNHNTDNLRRARVHDIDTALLTGLWSQFEPPSIARRGLLLEAAAPISNELKMPRLPQFLTTDPARPDRGLKDLRTGVTLDLRVRFQNRGPGRALLDTRTTDGRGFCLSTAAHGVLELLLNDGRAESRWTSDPRLLGTEATHHITVIIDAGPKLILFVVDGQLCDGGESRQFGWGRFSPHLRDANGASTLRIGSDVQHSAGLLRIYHRALRVSEAVQNHRSAAP